MKKLLRWLFRLILSLVILIVIVLAAVTFLKIPIDLTSYKKPVEALISKAINRPVSIEQSIVISTSLKPFFTLSGLRIGNTDGFAHETFMYLDSARIQVELIPLVKRKIQISEISVQKLQLTLEENADGRVNWALVSEDATPEPATEKKDEPEPGRKPNSQELASDTVVVRKLVLQDIAVEYYSPDAPEPATYHMEKCVGSMVPGKPLHLDMVGSLLTFPYTLDISIASLEEFLTQNSSWMEIKAEIAETSLAFQGNIDLAEAHKSLSLQAAVSGKNLRSLNDLLRFDLPPLLSYSIETNLRVQDQLFEMKNLTVKTGSSSLTGTALIAREKETIRAEAHLQSPLIQINDFVFDDWSWSGEETKSIESVASSEGDKASQNDAIPAGTKNRKLLDPDVLNTVNSIFTIKADQVLSGDDKLGAGRLEVTVRDGRIALEPLELQLPGGSIALSASLKPGKELSDASLKAVMKNFDIGIVVRRQNPEAKMNGVVNLDVDLTSSATSLDQILANGNGYFDFSGQLNNLGAEIIDLWAVNLVAAIVSSTDENQSQINCAVGRWSVNDGLLTPDTFFIDTSKIRICGKGQIDFKKERIDLIISPTPKKAEFFSLATPLEVHGALTDIKLGIQTGGLVGTTARFITSPLTVPIKRLVSEGIPKDGSDACTVTLGADNRTEISVKGCK